MGGLPVSWLPYVAIPNSKTQFTNAMSVDDHYKIMGDDVTRVI